MAPGHKKILKLRVCRRCSGLYETKGIKRSMICPNCTRGNRAGVKTGQRGVGLMHDHKKKIIKWN